MSCRVVESVNLDIHAVDCLFASAHVVKLFIEITISSIFSVSSGKTSLSICDSTSKGPPEEASLPNRNHEIIELSVALPVRKSIFCCSFNSTSSSTAHSGVTIATLA